MQSCSFLVMKVYYQGEFGADADEKRRGREKSDERMGSPGASAPALQGHCGTDGSSICLIIQLVLQPPSNASLST